VRYLVQVITLPDLGVDHFEVVLRNVERPIHDKLLVIQGLQMI
jgi:hypothetical protein